MIIVRIIMIIVLVMIIMKIMMIIVMVKATSVTPASNKLLVMITIKIMRFWWWTFRQAAIWLQAVIMRIIALAAMVI